jgi:zinc protease
MYKCFFAFVVSLITFGLSALTADETLPLQRTVRHHTYENGITSYVWPNESEKMAHIRLIVPVGSVHEEEAERGIAHLIEHLMFRGTTNYSKSEIDAFLHSIDAAMWADGNAFTSFDRTVYWLEVPADNLDAIATALDLMRDWISCATLYHRDIEAERAIVMEEWRLGLGTSADASAAIVPLFLPDSKYLQRLPIGLPEVIEGASPELIRQFYQKWYLHAPVGVVVTGAVDGDVVEGMVADRFASLPQYRSWEQIPNYRISPQPGHRVEIISSPMAHGTGVLLLLNELARPVQTMADERDELLETFFHHMLGVRLTQLAETTPGLYKVDCETDRLVRSHKTHMIIAACGSDKVEPTLRALLRELVRVQRDGFTAAEFKQAADFFCRCAQLAAEMRFFNQKDLADLCTEHFLEHGGVLDPVEGEELLTSLIAELNATDVTQFARELLTDAAIVACVLTDQLPDQLNTNQAALIQLFEALEQEEITPWAAAQLPAWQELVPQLTSIDGIENEIWHPELGILECVLVNGMHVHLYQREGSSETVALRGWASGGLAMLPNDQILAGRVANGLLAEAKLGPFNADGVDHIRAHSPTTLEAQLRLLNRRLDGHCFASDLEEMLQLVHLAFTDQHLSPAAFETAQQEWSMQIDLATRDPASAFDALSIQVNTSSNPLFCLPLMAEVRELPFDDVVTVTRDAFSNPADFDFFLVGDFDLEEVKELMSAYLATIPQSRPRQQHQMELPSLFPAGINVHELMMGCEPQTKVELSFPIALTHPSHQEVVAIRVAERVVRERLHDLLRNRLNSTYHTTTDLHYFLPATHRGCLTIGFCCDPEDAEILARIVLRELRLLLTYGPLEEEVAFVKQQQLRQLEEQFEFNSFWASALRICQIMNWDPTFLNTPDKHLRELTLTQVHNQIKNIIDLKRYTLLLSNPEREN